ncbi:hypothetical protein HPP92_021583 [Vanilla planifolia]|uniref:Uncharacterized protein n=1 Tax=Vanilla planifolia TaxID=51239 RepID=A0A835PVN6_VANPL|nr:hypothetical protein HPP92_021583 [Vanilla planifolia]
MKCFSSSIAVIIPTFVIDAFADLLLVAGCIDPEELFAELCAFMVSSACVVSNPVLCCLLSVASVVELPRIAGSTVGWFCISGSPSRRKNSWWMNSFRCLMRNFSNSSAASITSLYP